MEKVAVIGSAGVPCRYGGFETLAHHLVLDLNDTYDLHVYCSSEYYASKERSRKWNNATLHYVPLSANGWQSIFYDLICTIHALFYADYLLILGISGCIFLPFIKLISNKKVIINLDGIEWKRARWKGVAKFYLKLAEKLAVNYSDKVISDNQIIKEYVLSNYNISSDLIEYGGDQASYLKYDTEDSHKYPFLKNAYAFSVCRIVPENNIHMILNAFSHTPNKTLAIVGNWNSSIYGKELFKQYCVYRNINLIHPIYDINMLNKLRSNSYVYVHGHQEGGTNPSLVEAMNLGLPIICFDVSFNRSTTENEALYYDSPGKLLELLDTTKAKEFYEVGNKLKKIALRRYKWNLITRKYAELISQYGQIKQLKTKPEEASEPYKRAAA